MSKTSLNEINSEQKKLTKCIFAGLTIKQIAKQLGCSKSAVSYKMTKLFQIYNTNTRLDFVMAVFGEILNKTKKELKEKDELIKQLNEELDRCKIISFQNEIIKDNKKACLNKHA